MALETNLNQSPYFDDFDETKNFHRVLFRPGYAVQARELTQLQTILQNQIERFGDEILVDGTIVTGAAVRIDNIDFVKLRDKDANNRVLLLTDFFSGGVVANATVTGTTSGMTAQLIDVAEGSEANDPNFLSLFVKYTNSGTNNTTKTFADNEVLTIRNRTGNAYIVAGNTITSDSTGLGTRATVTDGVIYHKGHFVRVAAQSHIVDKYSTTPSKKVGFQTVESIVDSNADSSLLDNASGSTNFAAPGANRLKLLPTLASRAVGTANTATFFTVAELKDGEVVKNIKNTVYSDLGKHISQRFYDTHGNYAIEPFTVRIREHLKESTNLGRYTADESGSATKLIAEVDKGIGYVNGQKVHLIAPTPIEFTKATDFTTKDARVLSQNFGNYVICNEVVGDWDFQGLREIDLYDAAQLGISQVNFGAQNATGNKIGTARVRGFNYHSGVSGTPTGQFKIYIFDIKMNTGKSFSSVKSLFEANSGYNSLADIVLDTTHGTASAKIQEPSKNNLVLPFAYLGTKTLKDESNNVDTQFVFRTQKSVTFTESGLNLNSTFSANSAHAGATETMNETGNLTSDQERQLIVVSRQTVHSDARSGHIVSINGTAVVGGGTQFLQTYQAGDVIRIVDGSNNYIHRISTVNSDTSITLANSSPVTRSSLNAASGVSHNNVFPKGYIFDMAANGAITSTSSQHNINLQQANLASTMQASVSYNVLRSSAVQSAKTVKKSRYVSINTQSHSATNNGPWSLGVSDVFKIEAVYLGSDTSAVTVNDTNVTSHFTLDDGQKDDMYDTSKLVKKSTSSLDIENKAILVKFSFFERDYSQGIGYLSVDSYPVNDNAVTSTTIKTWEIPSFVSPATGKVIELRDAVDFRPFRANTCNPTTTGTLAGSPTNPGVGTNFQIDSDGAYMMSPGENFQADVQHYLPRKDRIIITEEGKVEVVKGTPSNEPRVPEEKANAMTIGILDIPVYPSLSTKVARDNDKHKYGVKLTLDNNRRYTMKDLRGVDERLRNTEYYSSLNALEASAKNKQLFNSSGFDRFKNGFFVENFDGHNLSDSTKIGYRASIDRNNNLLRPFYKRRDVQMEKDKSFTSSNITQTGNLLTLGYTHATFINQDKASKARNPVQELTFNWEGNLTLDPPMDNTPDITSLPDIQMDFSGIYESFQQLAEHTGFTGTSWGDWINTQDPPRLVGNTWNTQSGRKVDTLQQQQQDQIRQGIQTSISASTQTFNIGNYVQEVSVRDFMRSRLIKFTAHGMKPSTRVYPYFDDELVNDFVTPTNSAHANTANEGSSITTDANGSVFGIFRIPDTEEMKFRIGTRRFKLQDVANTQIATDLVTTSSFADYTSIPLSITQRGASASLVVPQVRTEDVTDTRVNVTNVVIASRMVDPLSQTFSVNEQDSAGVFITKVDLFFYSKASSLPVTVQLREVENGFPTKTVLAYGEKTLFPASINVSTTSAATATTFTFDSPVFLKNYKEYCITVMPAGNSDEYAVWVGKLGGKDVDTSELIDKQPGAGVLLSSANDKTWSAIQSEDLKFKLYRANFNTTQGVLYLENPDNDFFNYDNLTGTFNHGEKIRSECVITVSNNATIPVGGVLRTNATSGSNFANGTVRQIVRNNQTGQCTLKVDAYGDFPTTASSNTNNVLLNGTWVGNTTAFTANTNSGFLDFKDTLNEKITLKNSTFSGTHAANTWVRGQVSGATMRFTSAEDLINNVVVPKIPVINYANTSTTFSVRTTTSGGVINSQFRDLEPEIENAFTDNEKRLFSKINETALSAVNGSKKTLVIKGLFNTSDARMSPVVDLSRANVYMLENVINNDATDEDTKEVGSAITRYFSKPVELADGQDAEDLKVYLTAYKPSGTDIKVYAQLKASEDTESLNDKDYTLLTQVTPATTISDSVNRSDFKEFEYGLSANTDGQNFLVTNSYNQARLNSADSNIVSYRTSSGVVHKTYKTFAFKIVMTSTTTASVPMVQDLRSIALQV